MATIAVVDYGMGNLRSVEKALEHAGAKATVSRDLDQIRGADGLVLPGVGAFPRAVENIRSMGLDTVLAQCLSAGVPLLGICLGLQLLFESSTENDGAWGLGFVQGKVDLLQPGGLKLPHIGWNEVSWSKPSRLTNGIADGEPFYFVHSYAPVVTDESDVLGKSQYGGPFVCAIEHDPLYAIQFHPEKSSSSGIRLLQNFNTICGE